MAVPTQQCKSVSERSVRVHCASMLVPVGQERRHAAAGTVALGAIP